MTIDINRARFTFLWFATFSDLILPNAPFAFLLRPDHYEEAILNDKGRWPWQERTRQHFWQYYLGSRDLTRVRPEVAWRYFVPVRVSNMPQISLTSNSERITAEGYIYPHGCAVLLTMYLDSQQSLDKTVAATLPLYSSVSNFQISWADGTRGHFNMQGVAENLIEYLNTLACGITADQNTYLGETFTISTILDGTGVSPKIELQEGQSIHRALEAWSNWNSTLWQQTILPPLNEHSLQNPKSSTQAKGHCIYFHPRTRVVWLPGYFGTTGEPRRTLGCYHRNLSLAHMQTQSLCSMANLIYEKLFGQRELSYALDRSGRMTMKILRRMLDGAGDTYKSTSIQNHIKHELPPEKFQQLMEYFHLKDSLS